MRTFLLLLLFASISNSTHAGSSGFGPFDLPPLGSNEFFREIPSFIAPSLNDTSKVKINLSTRVLNSWTYNIESLSDAPFLWDGQDDYPFAHGSFLSDMETYTVTPRVSYNTGHGIFLEAIIPVVHQTGGFLDRSIEDFHNAFGLGQHHRTDWVRNDISVVYVHPDGVTTSVFDSNDLRGTFLGNIITGLSYHTNKFMLPFCFRLLITLPTSDLPVTFDGHGHYTTIQISSLWEKGDFVWYHGAGFTLYENSESNGLNLERKRFSMQHTMEYRITESLSFLTHLVSASAVADYPQLDKPVVEITLGFKRKLGKGVFELGIIENLFFFDNSPDIGFHLGYAMTLF